MKKRTIYVWARPLSQSKHSMISHLDHTWVTTYPLEINPEKQSDPDPSTIPPENYWYCWGRVHMVASHQITTTEIDIETACGIVPANIKASDTDTPNYEPSDKAGAIEYYGLDGLCHQLTNQILVITGSADRKPYRVQNAHGYPLATFSFGNYGLNNEAWQRIKERYAPEVVLPEDDFDARATSIIAASKMVKMRQIRKHQQDCLRKLRAKAEKRQGHYNYYPRQRVIVIVALLRIRILIGKEKFGQLFPSLTWRGIAATAWLKPPESLT